MVGLFCFAIQLIIHCEKLLGISNQAVSKWETNQSCPDIELLPMIADVFEITLDELFDREYCVKEEVPVSAQAELLPWEDDETLRAVLFIGHRIVLGETLQNKGSICKEINFNYDGEALNIESYFNVYCEDVEGSVSAGGYVECGDVGKCVSAGSYVECGDVNESVTAGTYVNCGDIGENVTAGTYVECGDVGKNVAAGGSVDCGDVGGYVLKN